MSGPIRGADGEVQSNRAIWVDITDRVLAKAERARLHQQNLYLQDEIKADHNFEKLVGQSSALRAVLEHDPLVEQLRADPVRLGKVAALLGLGARGDARVDIGYFRAALEPGLWIFPQESEESSRSKPTSSLGIDRKHLSAIN